jgi:hypothetical protein
VSAAAGEGEGVAADAGAVFFSGAAEEKEVRFV